MKRLMLIGLFCLILTGCSNNTTPVTDTTETTTEDIISGYSDRIREQVESEKPQESNQNEPDRVYTDSDHNKPEETAETPVEEVVEETVEYAYAMDIPYSPRTGENYVVRMYFSEEPDLTGIKDIFIFSDDGNDTLQAGFEATKESFEVYFKDIITVETKDNSASCYVSTNAYKQRAGIAKDDVFVEYKGYDISGAGFAEKLYIVGSSFNQPNDEYINEMAEAEKIATEKGKITANGIEFEPVDYNNYFAHLKNAMQSIHLDYTKGDIDNVFIRCVGFEIISTKEEYESPVSTTYPINTLFVDIWLEK